VVNSFLLIGSPSWWKEAQTWFSFVKFSREHTDMSDEALHLAEEILKAAATNGTIPDI